VNNKLKSILSSLIVIGVVASMMSAGTMSFFNDEERAKGIFRMGTIDIEVHPDEGQTVTTLEGHTDLKPCETGYIELVIRNVGTNPLELWKHITNVVNFENGTNDPEEEYYEEYPESVYYNISDYVRYDLWVNDTEIIAEGDDYVLTENESVETMLGVEWIGVECSWIYLGVLQPGEWIVVNQSYHLDARVENWGQTDYITFDMEFLAQQIEGAIPPEPTPTLIGRN